MFIVGEVRMLTSLQSLQKYFAKKRHEYDFLRGGHLHKKVQTRIAVWYLTIDGYLETIQTSALSDLAQQKDHTICCCAFRIEL